MTTTLTRSGFSFPPKTQHRRRELAAAILWILLEEGDIEVRNNAFEVLEKRLADRGIRAQRTHVRYMVRDLEEDADWGGLVMREIDGKRTKKICLIERDPYRLPLRPEFPTETAAAAAAASDEALEAAELEAEQAERDERERLEAAEYDNRFREIANAEGLSVTEQFLASTQALEQGTRATQAPNTEPAPASQPSALIDLTDDYRPFVPDEDLVPFEIEADVAVEGDPVQTLLDASGLLQAAMVQIMAKSSEPGDDELKTRLAAAIQHARTLQNRLDKVVQERNDANAAAESHYKALRLERGQHAQTKANLEAITKAARGGVDGFTATERFMQRKPSEKG